MPLKLPFRGAGVALLLTCALISLQRPALAQAPPDGGGPPPGRGGFGRGGGMFGPGGGQTTAATAPIAALESALKLTAIQKDKIIRIQRQLSTDRRDAMPQFTPGTPPDRDAFQAAMEKVKSLDDKASKQIEAALTDDQKAKLPGVLKDIQLLNSAGLPPELLTDLKLTDDQKKQLDTITKESQKTMQAKMNEARQSGDFASIRTAMQESRKATQEKVQAVLTDDQKAMVTKYEKEHPRRGPGGGSGRGGPGGFGGPPPPGGPGGQP